MAKANNPGTVGSTGISQYSKFFLSEVTEVVHIPDGIAAFYDGQVFLENPGFDTTQTLAMFAMNLPEVSLGDNVELPPQVGTATDVVLMNYTGFRVPMEILAMVQDEMVEETPRLLTIGNAVMMGYKGYWVSQRVLAMAQDFEVEKVTPAVLIYNQDGENQINTGLWFSTDDQLDSQLEILPLLAQASDTILMNYTGHKVPTRILAQFQDYDVEKLPTAVTVIYNDWTTDGENQVDNTWRFTQDDVMDSGVERIQIALTTGWDTDSDQQIPQPLMFGQDDVSDSGVENIIFYRAWDNDEDQQFLQPLWYQDQNEFWDRVILVQPYRAWDTDAEQQFYTGLWFTSDDQLDSQTELVEIKDVYGWDTDAEQQFNTGVWFGQDDVLDSGVERIVLPFNDWTTDGEHQSDHTWIFGQDDVLDSGVERIVLPFNPWDGDQDSQDHTWRFGQDDVLDSGVERIVLPFNPWDTDADQQFDITWRFSTDDVLDSGVELVEIKDVYGWDNDEDQQFDMTWRFTSDHLLDWGVELVQPYRAWDNDEDQQIPSPLWNLDQEEFRDRSLRIILPYQDWTQDEEWQQDRTWVFGQDDVSDSGVELITVPRAWDNDEDQQFTNQWQFSTDDVLDSGVERIQIALTTGWDNDEDQQFDHTWTFTTDDVLDPNVELTTIPTGWDNDEDQQFDHTWRFQSDTVMDEGQELVEIKDVYGWDTDADQQFDHSWFFGQDDVFDSMVEHLPFVGTATDVVLMNYTDYWFGGRFPQDPEREEFVEIALTMGWDTDSEQQFDRTWTFGQEDVFDAMVENLPPLYTITNTIMMGYKGYQVPQRMMMDLDVFVENILFGPFDEATDFVQTGWTGLDQLQDITNYIILPPNVWDTDSDEQLQQPGYQGLGSDQGQDWTMLIITPPIVFQMYAWDTDGDHQFDNSWKIGDDQLDSGVELVQIADVYGWDTDGENQFQQPDWYRDQNEFWDRELSVEPYMGWDDQNDVGQSPWTFQGSDQGQDTTNYVIQPPNVWDTDGDEQLLNPPYQGLGSDQGQDWTQLIIVPPIVLQLYSWDTDGEMQFDTTWRIGDDVADSGVEYITLPHNVWDNDGENQKLNPDYQGLGSDQGQDWTNYIILAFNPDTIPKDDDQQLFWTPMAKDVLGETEWTNTDIIAYGPWDNDEDQQFTQPGWMSDEQERAQFTNLVILPYQDWTTDGENQKPLPDWYRDETEFRDWPNLIVYGQGVLSGWDQDEEQQQPWTLWFDKDSQEIKEWTNYIVLPPTPWVAELFTEIERTWKANELGSDQGQEWTYYLIVPSAWDNDQDQQMAQPGWTQEPIDERSPLIIYPEGVINRDWSLIDDQLMWALWNLDQSDEWNLLRELRFPVPLKAYKVALLLALLDVGIQVRTQIIAYKAASQNELVEEEVETRPSLTIEEVQVQGVLTFDSIHTGDC